MAPRGAASSFWYSTNAMSCVTPSSVTTKFFAVRPSIGFPFLSFTVTVWTMSSVDDRKTGACAGCCWAKGSEPMRSATTSTGGIRALISEPEDEVRHDPAHLTCVRRPAELRAGDHAIDCRERDMVEHVRSGQAPVEIESAGEPECP